MSNRKPALVRMPDKSGDQIACLLTADSYYEGLLWSPNGVRVECPMKGSLVTPGKIFISSGARVDGTVICGELICDGMVEGHIFCTGKVRMSDKSCVNGTIHTKLFENESNERMICSIYILTEDTIMAVQKALEDLESSDARMDKPTIRGLVKMFRSNAKPTEMTREDEEQEDSASV